MQSEKPQLIQGDPALLSSVARLASMPGVESAATGYAATPSPAHAAFVEVKTRATPEQALALLAHPSPVVRLYLARHIAREAPEHLASLEPLLDDETPVSVTDGCLRGVAPVAEWVVTALCEAPTQPGTLPLLQAAARRPALGSGRFEALRRLGALAPAEACGLAGGIALDPAQPGEAVAQALEAFWALAPSDDERLALARSLLERPGGLARVVLPRLLSSVRAEGALALLSSLRQDPHGGVKSSADFYWAAHPKADPGEVEALIRAKLAGGDRSFLLGLVSSEDPAWHALLVEFVRGNREVTLSLDNRAPSAVFFAHRARAGLVRCARGLLGRDAALAGASLPGPLPRPRGARSLPARLRRHPAAERVEGRRRGRRGAPERRHRGLAARAAGLAAGAGAGGGCREAGRGRRGPVAGCAFGAAACPGRPVAFQGASGRRGGAGPATRARRRGSPRGRTGRRGRGRRSGALLGRLLG
jgi:hypothetical protein